jgi:integrase
MGQAGIKWGMSLALYRRHRQQCKTGHPHNTRTSEYDERKKGFRRCECPIFASGTLSGTFKRQNSGHWEWDDAKAVAATWEQVGSWDGKVAPLPTPVSIADPTEVPRMAIADAAKVFLAHHEGAKISRETLRKYRTFTNQITTYTEGRGYVLLDQITSADIDLFYANWKLGARTKGKALGKLRSFFRFCAKRKWVTIDITDPKSVGPVSSDLKPPIGANRAANKFPFTDEELQRIIDACERMKTVKWSNWQGSGVWTGEDVKDFIWTMVYTGLRISDTALFQMKRLRGNEVYLRAKKNGGDVFAYLPDWLRDRLVARAEKRGPRPFVVGQSDRLETVTDMWRRKINSVFALAGAFDEPPTTHRFRHSFARILLQRGVPVADVADLLGDDEKTVREHYARWVPERQARLTGLLKDAFEDKPKPKLVAIR